VRRIPYESGPIRVLVDLPEEIFQSLKEAVPNKLRQSVAALAVHAINNNLKGTTK